MRLQSSCPSIKWIGESGNRVKLLCDRAQHHGGNHYDEIAALAWDNAGILRTPTEKGDFRAGASRDSSAPGLEGGIRELPN
jgi:hypothetical protein